ncbi:hypothetical protein MG293_011259 [Ovis ammon polii]|uniref:Uncharacterized protein n=1 Tax=Ovis ammon polii TaxID=230172 RepID=A0AAD4Y9G8_OVIAM|nr:hypothetical protein MG293_011259 [Ovis ammon polii]
MAEKLLSFVIKCLELKRSVLRSPSRFHECAPCEVTSNYAHEHPLLQARVSAASSRAPPFGELQHALLGPLPVSPPGGADAEEVDGSSSTACEREKADDTVQALLHSEQWNIILEDTITTPLNLVLLPRREALSCPTWHYSLSAFSLEAQRREEKSHTQGVRRSQKLQGSEKRAVSISRYLSVLPGYCQLEFVSFLQLRDAWKGMIGDNLKPLCRIFLFIKEEYSGGTGQPNFTVKNISFMTQRANRSEVKEVKVQKRKGRLSYEKLALPSAALRKENHERSACIPGGPGPPVGGPSESSSLQRQKGEGPARDTGRKSNKCYLGFSGIDPPRYLDLKKQM